MTPAVNVSIDGVALALGTDYSVSYRNNKNIGIATVTITGMGSYTGTVERQFAIGIYGDADGDGVLSAADRTMLEAYLANPENYDLSPDILNYLDVNGDSVISAADAELIGIYLVNVKGSVS